MRNSKKRRLNESKLQEIRRCEQKLSDLKKRNPQGSAVQSAFEQRIKRLTQAS